VTSQVFRDVSAWYHIVVSVDTTSPTADNRIRLYVNGSEVTTFATKNNPTQNADLGINDTAQHSIGSQQPYSGGRELDAYLADLHFCDGTAYDASAFGEFSATTGVWMPKQFAGSYGSQGWKLSFSDNSTAAALGTDTSGNGNTWTVNNISVASGAGNDSLVDVPTNGSEVDTGSGGQVRGNYCTWNPLKINTNGSLANGNLDWSSSSSGGLTVGTIGVSSGKWYWEVTINSGTNCGVGVFDPSAALTTYSSDSAKGIGYYGSSGGIFYSGGSTSYGNTFTTGDTIGVALDLDNGKIYFSKNGTWQNSGNPATQTNPARTGLSGTYAPEIDAGASSAHSASLNAGARSFAYTAPTGFKALNTSSLPAPVITKPSTVMDVKLYTGNGSTQTISGLGFSPDLVWIKKRSAAGHGPWYDVLRGTGKAITSSLTNSEYTAGSTQELTAFNSDGFSLGTDYNFDVNTSSQTFVAWAWDAGTSNATNTSGTISSTVRANISAGFSIVSYTGTGSNATVGHGLGVAPQMVIIKRRSGANDWIVGHTALGGWGYFLYLNLTNAKDGPYSTIFQSTAPTSSVFSLGNSTYVNGSSETYVAYCFAPVAGFSAFGSYTGNGSTDGPFVYTGFRPRWVLIKESSASGNNWNIWDAARDDYNATTKQLKASSSDAEATNTFADFNSNGFKIRVSTSGINTSSATYIYAAFAESPFQYARAR
jgi:hypothetical protein